jgi:hypothetical protein
MTLVDQNEKFKILSLYFFRDITDAQRLKIFQNLKVLPLGSVEPLQQSAQIQLLDQLKDRVSELDAEISFEKMADR